MEPDNYEAKRQIGIVQQNVAVFDEFTVYENIDYFCGLYINDRKKRKQLVEEAIAFVGLEDYRKIRPKKLTGFRSPLPSLRSPLHSHMAFSMVCRLINSFFLLPSTERN